MPRLLLATIASTFAVTIPVLAQQPAGPRQIAPADQREINNAKLWNANPSGRDLRDFQGVWLIRHDVFGAQPLTGALVDTAGAQQFVPKTPLQIATGQHRID